MAKKARGLYAKVAHEPIFHKTNIGRNPSLAKMNKSRRNPVAKQLRHFKQKMIKNKKAYDRKKLFKISSRNS